MELCYGDMRLRAVEEEDLDLLRWFLNDAATEEMTEGGCFPISRAAQAKWFASLDAQKDLRYIIDINNHAVGTLGIVDIDWKNRTGSIYYKMLAECEYRFKGDTKCAVNALLKYAFNSLGLNCIYALALQYNIKSQALLDKSGFTKEGILRARAFKNGVFQDELSYSILAKEFRAY